jgi:membrane protein required for colicin V production
MNGADWLIIIIVAFSSLLGLMRGLVHEVVALLTWIIGLWCAWSFSYLVEPYLGGLLDQPNLKVWIARLIILVAVLFLGGLIAMVLGGIIRRSPFSTSDRLLGLFFGLLRSAVVVGVLVIAAQQLQLTEESWYQKAKLMKYAEGCGEWIHYLVDNLTLKHGA